jgi:uncharacterized membrane protein
MLFVPYQTYFRYLTQQDPQMNFPTRIHVHQVRNRGYPYLQVQLASLLIAPFPSSLTDSSVSMDYILVKCLKA